MDKVLQKQTPMTTEQRKLLSNMRIKVDISPFEAEIIKELRKISYGKVTIQVTDDVPFRVTKETSEMIIAGTDSFDTLSQVKRVSVPS